MTTHQLDADDLKSHIVEVLNAVLSPDHDIRCVAEQKIKVFEVMEDFGVCLAELTVDSEANFAIRQMASLVLKQYVETHWCRLSEKFVEPETTDLAKCAIKQMLPLGLRDPSNKIRATIAYAISAIAHWDWPENWTDLFPIIMEAVHSGNPDCVHGAMRVLTEFSRELTDVNIAKVAPIIFPELYLIFMEDQKYSIRTRARAVEIYNTCACLIHDTANSQLIELLLPGPFVSKFTHALAEALQVPNGPVSDCGLKKEVLNTLINMMRNDPKLMGDAASKVLSAVWQQLIQGAEYFVSREVNCAEEDTEAVIDSDGESLSFGNLVYSLFDFIESLLDSIKLRKIVKKSLDELIYYLIIYMQMTEEQAQCWIQNPDQFVEDEDEDSFSFSVRISAQDLFLACCKDFKKESALALMKSMHRHLQEAQVKNSKGDVHWWKIHEACFLALGSVRALVMESLERSVIQFDFGSFLANVVSADLNSGLFLAGRSLWIASRFASFMDKNTLQHFLEATVKGLQADQQLVIRISAVRSVHSYCDHLNNVELTMLLTPYVSLILEGLFHLVTQATVEVLSLALETMRVTLSIDMETTSKYHVQIISLATAVVLKYANDPLVSSLASDLLTELASHGTCTELLQVKLLPTLVSIFNAPPNKVASGLVSMSMDILCKVIRKLKPPLPLAFIENGFTGMVKCAMETDDNSILQSAGECARAYVAVSTEQLCQWHDREGNTGAFYVMQLISVLLNPKLPEYSASFAGRLVSVFIAKTSDRLTNDDVDLILRAVLGKLQQSVTLTVVQSLLLIFAHLVNSRIEMVISFLSQIPGPSGGDSALHFVMNEWCDKQTLFYGSYDKKVGIVALSKVLQYGLTTNNAQLSQITVRGERIFAEGIQTRSKTVKEPEKWTVVPLLVKIYKLLLAEVASQMETSKKQSSIFEWEDVSESDEDDADSEDGRKLLSELLNDNSVLGFDGDYDDNEFSDDDEDAVDDPINDINVLQFLTSFLKDFFNSEVHHSHFVPHLNETEKSLLGKLVQT